MRRADGRRREGDVLQRHITGPCPSVTCVFAGANMEEEQIKSTHIVLCVVVGDFITLANKEQQTPSL